MEDLNKVSTQRHGGYGRAAAGQWSVSGEGGGGGLGLWFTGLPGSGKSTLSRALAEHIGACDQRLITLLDGDAVRLFLSPGAGFSRKDRYENVCRIGYAASLIVRHGGIAIAATVSPYRDARAKARNLVEAAGGVFLEIHIDTPFSACVARDPKGHYARALAGEMAAFTGVDDPYEKPLSPDLRIRTEGVQIESCAALIMRSLSERRLLVPKNSKTACVRE